jgi:hypothetical protein
MNATVNATVSAVLARILATLNKRDIDDQEQGDRFNADSTFVVEENGWVVSYDYDSDREDGVEHHKVYNATLKEIVENAVELAEECGADLDEVNNLASLANRLFGDDDNLHATIRTEADQNRAELEERRKECEKTASEFARECGHSVGTREFVQMAKEKIAEVDNSQERWNSHECKMERWADCYHSGSRDAYWQDNDYMQGKFYNERERLESVLDYMRDAFPLLMLHIEQEEATSDNGGE